MPEHRMTSRYDIKNALSSLKALQMELEAGLRPSKGFVAHTYLYEKWGYLQTDMERILKSSGTVEPPKETV